MAFNEEWNRKRSSFLYGDTCNTVIRQYSNILEIVWAFSVFWSRPKHSLPPGLPRSGGNAFTTWVVELHSIRYRILVIALDFCCIYIGLVFIKERPVSSFWVLRFRSRVLRFRVLGASFSRFGCFVFEFWVLRASVFVFECFVFETTYLVHWTVKQSMTGCFVLLHYT